MTTEEAYAFIKLIGYEMGRPMHPRDPNFGHLKECLATIKNAAKKPKIHKAKPKVERLKKQGIPVVITKILKAVAVTPALIRQAEALLDRYPEWTEFITQLKTKQPKQPKH